MYFTGIVNSVYHWSRRFSLLLFNNCFFPFKLAFIYVLCFSFVCITVFEIKLFNAVKTLGYGPRRVWFGRVEIEMISVCDRLEFERRIERAFEFVTDLFLNSCVNQTWRKSGRSTNSTEATGTLGNFK